MTSTRLLGKLTDSVISGSFACKHPLNLSIVSATKQSVPTPRNREKHTSTMNHSRSKSGISSKEFWCRIHHILQIWTIPLHTNLCLDQDEIFMFNNPCSILSMFND